MHGFNQRRKVLEHRKPCGCPINAKGWIGDSNNWTLDYYVVISFPNADKER
jgi:hypothetical protein